MPFGTQLAGVNDMMAPQAIKSGVVVVLLAVIASGCTSTQRENSRERLRDMRPDRVEVKTDRKEMRRAAESPLYDFNFKRDEIPEPLANLENIYEPPPSPSCRNMRVEVAVLTEILGPDSELTNGDSEKVWSLNPSDALESAVSSFIPFNDIIRYLSGANEHEKKLAKAYFRGQIRRAYLRGWAAEQRCDIPRPVKKPTRLVMLQ